MNFDLFYTEKTPYKLTKKEKVKLIESLFHLKNHPDKKIELFLFENWNKLFGTYSNYIHLKYVKNQILYVEVDSKSMFQDIVFLISKINHMMKLSIGETLKTIKIVPTHHLKKQKVFVHEIENNREQDIYKKNRELILNENFIQEDKNLKLLQEIKSILLKEK